MMWERVREIPGRPLRSSGAWARALAVAVFFLPGLVHAAGYVVVKTPAAPIELGGKRIGIAGKGFAFSVMTPSGDGYVIQVKNWNRRIFPRIPGRYVRYTNQRPEKVIASIQELEQVCPVTPEMKDYLRSGGPEKKTGKVLWRAGGEEKKKPQAPEAGRSKPAPPQRTARPAKTASALPKGLARKDGRLVWEKDGAEMVEIPAGSFLFGRNKEKKELPRFFIDRFEVTNARYRLFVKATGHPEPPYWHGASARRFGEDKKPVVGVSFQDAVAYAEWAGKRLPTEEEWEKAARGTDGRTYPWGNDRATAELVHFEENPRVGATSEVGQYPLGRSPYGVDDLAGNVAEWVDAWFGPDKLYRVLKGGSWYDRARYLRACNREDRRPEDSGISWGFRCAVSGK